MKKEIYADLHAVGERKENLKKLVEDYQNQGADGYYIYDFSRDAAVRDRFLHVVREIRETVDFPFVIGIAAERFEDVKKALYTGADRVYLHPDVPEAVLKEAISRFGSGKVGMELDYSRDQCRQEELIRLQGLGIRQAVIKHVESGQPLKERLAQNERLSVMIRDSLRRNDLEELLEPETVSIVASNFYEGKDIRKVKLVLRDHGVAVCIPESRIPFASFKKNADGLVPVIVQDYQNNEVLMLAYMNEESYNKTIETGKMTYFSRSRNELWCKGDTSGHYQYVKKLDIDCDQDTILAKVRQVGAACHTGSRSCFYTELAVEESGAGTQSGVSADGKGSAEGSLAVLREVYRTILDRKAHPKEGSYTNYLFDKGIDKILKKCGEESAEIIIAAKNPDAMELKYEIADYLYHLMVLMAETGLTWKEIMEELAGRH